jgi:tetratricopeptide (TPR) repeat protein
LALALRRLTAWAHNRRGELRSEAREQHDALADFQAAIRLDPNCWTAIHNRGVTFAQQGQSAAALRDFNRVLELNPGLAIAARNRAELFAALGRMDEAVRDYASAIEQLPDDAELYRARAYAWQRLGDFDRALDDLNESLSLAPDQAEAYTQRGNLAAEQGEYDRALSNFQQSLRFDADWCETHRSLAWLWATCPDPRYRDSEQALRAAEQAVQLAHKGDSFALDTLAAAHANAGHFDEAARIEQQAISAAPPDALASFQDRLALYQQGQPYRSETPRTAVEPALYTAPESPSGPALR